MIVVKSRGGLGNQLFQFAFAYSASRQLNALFAIDKIDAADRLGYFSLKGATRKTSISGMLYKCKLWLHPRLYQYLIEICFHISNFLGKRIEINQNDWQQAGVNAITLADKAYYKGYFQSEAFFRDYSSEVKTLFKVREKYRKQFAAQFAGVFGKQPVLVIHVRRTDYLNSGSAELGRENLSLPMEYYLNALQRIDNLLQYKIVIISDDVPFCQQTFRHLPNPTYSNNSEIVDLQLLCNADVLIIANSTFAWWGAYLNPKSDKRVFVPRHWLGFHVQKEFPAGITDINWEKVDF